MFPTEVAPRELRPHQVAAIEMLRASLLAGHRRVVLQAPTGFGKSITAANIIGRSRVKGHRVLFTVPRLSLVDQAVADFEREGIGHIGVLQASHPRTDASAPVQVATAQTLMRRIGALRGGLGLAMGMGGDRLAAEAHTGMVGDFSKGQQATQPLSGALCGCGAWRPDGAGGLGGALRPGEPGWTLPRSSFPPRAS